MDRMSVDGRISTGASDHLDVDVNRTAAKLLYAAVWLPLLLISIRRATLDNLYHAGKKVGLTDDKMKKAMKSSA